MSENVLIVEFEIKEQLFMTTALQGYLCTVTPDHTHVNSLLTVEDSCVVVILDLDRTGVDFLPALAATHPHVQVIGISDSTEALPYIHERVEKVPRVFDPIFLRTKVETIFLRSNLQCVEEELAEQKQFFHALLQQTPIGIAIADERTPTGERKDDEFIVNPVFEKITGWTNEELIHHGWAKISHPDDVEEDLKQYRKLLSHEISSYSMDKRYIKKDGTIVWVSMTMGVLNFPGFKTAKYVCLIQDITDRKQAEYELAYSYDHDTWTGLYNRSYFEAHLKAELSATPYTKSAIISMNLSPIYELSIRYGFQYAQDLVKKIADALKHYCHEDKELYYAHENRFAFYVKRYSEKKDLLDFTQELNVCLKGFLVSDRLSWGIGVIEITENNRMQMDHLLHDVLITSEYSLSQFDHSCKIYFFEDALRDRMLRRNQINNDIEAIIAAKSDTTLLLYFQPIIDLKTNRICSFEALSRLSSSTLGIVSPLDFIPIAERTKLIVPLGKLIIREACAFSRLLQDHGACDVTVSINIAPQQLLEEGFCDQVLIVLKEYKLKPSAIVLELTESALSSHFHTINIALSQLHGAGIKTALDDFGTGYSSLSRERELAVSIIKIDKSFIDNLAELSFDEAITGDIVSMAHRMKQRVIAEGVETEEQLQYLKEVDCDMIQGYFFSKPLEAMDALKFFQSWHFER